MTIEIYNSERLEGKRLSVNATVALYNIKDMPHVSHQVKSKLAARLASKILESDEFFRFSCADEKGSGELSYRADCIVLTSQQYGDLLKKAFNDGLRHATHFYPMDVGAP